MRLGLSLPNSVCHTSQLDAGCRSYAGKETLKPRSSTRWLYF